MVISSTLHHWRLVGALSCESVRSHLACNIHEASFAPAMFMAFPGVFLSVEEADSILFFIIIIIIINLIYLINIIYLINLICKAPKQAMKRSIFGSSFH